jgi:hypothetical protein
MYVYSSTRILAKFLGGEERSGQQESEGDRDRSHAQAGIHNDQVDSRARNEEQFIADFANGVV